MNGPLQRSTYLVNISVSSVLAIIDLKLPFEICSFFVRDCYLPIFSFMMRFLSRYACVLETPTSMSSEAVCGIPCIAQILSFTSLSATRHKLNLSVPLALDLERQRSVE